MLKVGTLFSGGLGGVEFALKYENIEHEVVLACEFDKYARKQYKSFHNYDGIFEHDVRYLNYLLDTPLIPDLNLDLLVWGSPCQDLSLAGKREGFNGEKSSLFRIGAKIQSKLMPKSFIFENVKGLLSSNHGKDLKEVINTFTSMGYHINTKVLNAKQHGTAQNRERLFIVGFLDSHEHYKFNFEEPIKLTKTLKDYIDNEVDEKYFLSERMINGFIAHKERDQERHNGSFKNHFVPTNGDKIAACLMCNQNKSTSDYIKVGYINQNTQSSSVSSTDGISNTLTSGTHGYAQGYIQLNQIGYINKNSQGNRVYDTQCYGTLSSNGGGCGAKTGLYAIKSATKQGYELATENDSINFTHPDSKTRRGRVGKNVAQTLDCSCNQAIIDSNIKRWSIFPFRIRKLTPIECFRLMGVINDDINIVVSDTQAYKIAGNGIEINTMRSILRGMYKNENIQNTLF